MLALPEDPLKRAGLVFTFLWFVIGGAGHFVLPEFFVSISPPWVPEPMLVVQVSGVIELLLAALLIPVNTRGLAGLALVALIAAVTPVHVYMLQVPEKYPQFPVAALWLRLVIQAFFIVNVWWSTRPEPVPSR